MKKELVKKIAELEKKIALSFDEYKKLHPKTRKTPSDPMFKTQDKQKKPSSNSAPASSSAAKNHLNDAGMKVKKLIQNGGWVPTLF